MRWLTRSDSLAVFAVRISERFPMSHRSATLGLQVRVYRVGDYSLSLFVRAATDSKGRPKSLKSERVRKSLVGMHLMVAGAPLGLPRLFD